MIKVIILSLFLVFSITGLSANENHFDKIDINGEILTKSNDDSESSEDWHCVLDNSSGLMWEVKSAATGLNFYGNSYTWFDGEQGVENGEFSVHCNWQSFCNTEAYVHAINEQKLCGFNDWRLPTFAELITLRRFPDEEPTINHHFFPHTQSHFYWSADVKDDTENTALDVPFFYGGSSGSGMEFNSFVRVVRNAD